jgi:hypothetical protein
VVELLVHADDAPRAGRGLMLVPALTLDNLGAGQPVKFGIPGFTG